MRKLFTIILCGFFVCVGGVFSTGSCYAEHWADQYLNNLVSQGIMRGDDDGNLYPDNPITRAEFVAMMNRAFGYSKSGSTPFNDVPTDAWYYDDINTAYNQGYFNGIYNDTAGPDTKLKREQAVAMLFRALKIEGTADNSLKFTDSRQFSSWSKDFINTAVEKNFLSGYPDDTFRPSGYMTRGEMAKVLSNVSGEIVKDTGSNYIGYASGNVSMVQSGADLNDTTVPGDMYITAGLGTGYTELRDVTVGGDLIISGTGNSEKGEISVTLTDCDINRLIIDCTGKNIMSVRADGSTKIETTVVKSNAYLEEASTKRGSAFRDVELKGPKDTKLSLSGDFEDVTVKNPNNKLSLDRGSIENLTIDEDAQKGTVYLEKDTLVENMFCDTGSTVTGTGEIENIVINADGSTISMLPDSIYIRPGVTATVNGKPMTSLEAEANSEDPEFIDDYPKYDTLTANSVKLYAETNKPGKVYWAVKNIDIDASDLSYDEVKKPDTKVVAKSGVVNVMTEKEVSIAVSGLLSGVNYKYYMVFEDLKGDYTSVERDSFQTIDTVVPNFLNGTPKITASNESSFTMTVIPSKDVTVYWGILPTKSVPPTVDTLVKQKLSGAVAKGILTGCMMNESKDILMSSTSVGAITEKTTYDIYLVGQDESGNTSKLFKVVGTTLDTTPPKFMDGYPWAEPSDISSLKARHMANEASTLYWAVYTYDATFPPVTETLTGSALKTAQVRAITTGQKAVKYGKVSVVPEKDAELVMSGLAKQTPYDVYMVLMDTAGNYSDIVSMRGLKTVDKTAPNASMKFDKVVDSKPTVDANIQIVFDEIVYYDSPDGNNVRLINLPADQKAAILKSMFTVHDLTTTIQPNVLTNVDYSNVNVAEKDGVTIVTFSKACFDGGNGLNSGSNYQFELNNVADSEGNAMSQNKLLTPFQVVPPQVYVSRYNGGNLDTDELGFTVTPTTGINSDKRFDIIIQTDQQIKFDVYEGSDPTKSPINTKSIIIEAGKAKSLTSILGKSDYDEFVSLNPIDYRIKIITLNGIEKQDSWDASLTVQTMAVIGDASDLNNLSQAISDKANPLDIVAGNKDTLVVSNPTIYKTTRVYSDKSQPVLIDGVNFEPFDTAVNVTAMADKTASLYYVTVPQANMVGKTDPTVDQVLAGLPSYLDSKTGTISLTKGNTQYSQKITELIPETDYLFYYVLKGKGLDDLKVVTDAAFTTKPIITPIFTDGPAPSGTANATSAEMQGVLNTDALVYWIMCPGGKYDDDYFKDKTGKITNPDNSDNTIVASGKVPAKKDAPFTFNCTPMDSTKTYDIFAIAISDYGKVQSEGVEIYRDLRSRDTIPPTLNGTPTTSIYEVNPVSSGAIIINKYNGYIAVRFSEPLYYKNTLSGSKMSPLTKDLVETTDSAISVLSYDRGMIKLNVEARQTDDPDSDGYHPITGINFTFEDIRDGNTIGIDGYIYDRGGNYAGQLKMTFIENDTKTGGSFEVEFIQ